MTLVPPIFLDLSELKHVCANRKLVLAHANSPETSLSFLREGALLSRQNVIDRKLPQSYQWSDSNDQRDGIFDSVFIDFSDQHRRFNEPNKYGPVLFRIDPERLFDYLQKSTARFSITKKAPHEWKPQDSPEQRWLSASELPGLFVNSADNTPASGFTNGWPSLVIASPREIALTVVAAVVVENPTSGLVDFPTFKKMAQDFAPNLLIRKRYPSECPSTCKCKMADGYDQIPRDRLGIGDWVVTKKTG